MLTETQRATGWPGFEPAGEEAIRAAEARIGAALPASYRNFLRVSDGWSSMSYSLDLLGVGEIGWFADLDPDILAAWSGPGLEDFAEDIARLGRCLLISRQGDGDYWLLSPDEIGADGEWRAYVWWAGDGEEPRPYEDFGALVAGVRRDLTDC